MRRGFGLAGLLAMTLAACDPSHAAGPTPLSPTAKRLLAELPPSYRNADIDNGRLHFNLCRSCHVVAQGGPNMVGPNLYGVFGRETASVAGFNYSAAMRAAHWRWDVAHLDPWLKSPRAAMPGTRMSFVGIVDDHDRRDVIAYLKIASGGGGM